MEQNIRPVDVISVCSASGEMKPLRLRVADASQEMFRIDIEEVLSIKEFPYIGAEATIFLCRATVGGQPWMFELKYTFRTHCWCIHRRFY